MRAKAANASLYTNVAQFVLSLCLAMPRRPHAWALRAHVGQTARHGRPRAPRFTRGASGGELCAACSRLRAVGWGLVDPELGLSIRFHSMGENFHTGRFSRPLCDCTGTARRVRSPPKNERLFGASPALPSGWLFYEGLYSGDLTDSARAASLSLDPTFIRWGASLGRSEREKQR